MKTGWVKFSLFYLLSIALLGSLMRLGFITGAFAENYKHILHAHSHIAFLGWVYPVLFLALTNNFLKPAAIEKGKYHLQFIITQFIIGGMFIAFLCQGYGVFSIILSTIFQLMTYWFTFRFLADLKKEQGNNFSIPARFARVALWSLFISSFGTWGLAVINARGLGKTGLYNMAIYFYLHFQYNGWFSFSIISLFFCLIGKTQDKFFNPKSKNRILSFGSIALTRLYAFPPRYRGRCIPQAGGNCFRYG